VICEKTEKADIKATTVIPESRGIMVLLRTGGTNIAGTGEPFKPGGEH